jgi:hypothetical protein
MLYRAFRVLLLGLPLTAVLTATAPASNAAVRTAALTDGRDPTLTYDLQRVRATLDRSSAELRVSVRLYRPFPTAFADYGYWYQGMSVAVTGAPTILDCRYGADALGAVHLSISPTEQAPTLDVPEIHEASARVAYRQSSEPVPLSFSGDRRTATVTVDDELLRGADLRCLSASSSGRTSYDPRQPGGGPTSETGVATYFSGFSPRARFKQAVRSCERRYRGHKHAVGLARCKRLARQRSANAI